MRGWVLLAVGLVTFGIAAVIGVVSWEVTLVLMVIGLVLAVLGLFQVIVDRRRPLS
jgi:hypothetical protein